MVSAKRGIDHASTFRHLSPRLAQLLNCLAVLEKKKDIATRKKLASMMRISPSNISYLVNRLKAYPVLYLKAYTDEGDLVELAKTTRNPGRLPTAYYLDVDRVISLAETARLVIEALDLSRKVGNLNRSELARHVVNQYGLAKVFVRERLAYCLKNGYLDCTDGKIITITDRTMAELGYLTLLAEGCKPITEGLVWSGGKKVRLKSPVGVANR
jgi:hypothetical protein